MSIDIVRKIFTSWAPYYDATHAWTLPYRHRARLALDVHPGGRVLDLACGTGLSFRHLHDLVGATGQVTGVDVTPAMLEIARARILQQGWSNVAVREADAADLPFPDESFDHALCAYALNIIPDYQRAIAEVARVLEPGGRFVVLDVQLPTNGPAGWLHWMPHICAIDLGHQTIDTLQRVFTSVEVRMYLAGVFYIAAATKA